MNILPLPKSWLIHDIEYKELLPDKDNYGNLQYKDSITIKNVRFEDETVFSRDSTNKKVLANAIIFIDSTNSISSPNRFIEESKIYFRNREYTIKKVAALDYPTKNEIHHWELEVI